MYTKLPEIAKRGFPVLTWSKNYNFDLALADLVAGITIGLTLIPQCIAYASLAGLGPEVGTNWSKVHPKIATYFFLN